MPLSSLEEQGFFAGTVTVLGRHFLLAILYISGIYIRVAVFFYFFSHSRKVSLINFAFRSHPTAAYFQVSLAFVFVILPCGELHQHPNWTSFVYTSSNIKRYDCFAFLFLIPHIVHLSMPYMNMKIYEWLRDLCIYIFISV